MECYLSITEMARQRNVTTETLRYYDRIGLLKPDYLDKNNVRYYSVLKYEQLETIKELQQLGLDLKEISLYLSDRCIDTSHELLIRQQKFCEEKVRYYQSLKEKIDRKVSLMSELKNFDIVLMKPEIIHIDKRMCISSDNYIKDEISLSYACMELERNIKLHDELAPVYASDCYAGQFSLQGDELKLTKLLFILHENMFNFPDNNIVTLPAGNYMHIYSNNSFWVRDDIQKCFNSYAQKNGLRLCDKAIVISKIDYSITDIPEERLYEFQVQILH